MFQLMFVHYTFSSIWISGWPPFGKKLPTRLAICSHGILSICDFFYFQFCFCERDLPTDLSSSCSLLSHNLFQQCMLFTSLSLKRKIPTPKQEIFYCFGKIFTNYFFFTKILLITDFWPKFYWLLISEVPFWDPQFTNALMYRFIFNVLTYWLTRIFCTENKLHVGG